MLSYIVYEPEKGDVVKVPAGTYMREDGPGLYDVPPPFLAGMIVKAGEYDAPRFHVMVMGGVTLSLLRHDFELEIDDA